MKPLRYWIRLEPDLQAFKFKGFVSIDLKLGEPVSEVVLNVKDLAVKECTVIYRCEEDECEYNIIEEREELHVKLPRLIKGRAVLKISYEGVINDLMLGFYRSRFITASGEEKYIAVTQFEEQEARRAFPCFDHPSMKAVFNIELIVDEKLTAISNTEILEERRLNDGRKLVRFTPTPLLSTYLVFFAVGEFEALQDASSKPVIRVLTAPGKSVYAEYALKTAKEALKFMEKYTGLEYPTGKCDYISVQDFLFGAMENYGAITFRENLLLVYPKLTNRSGLVRITSIIAHETAHLWFGDIVTPLDWSDLWLNESFATYFSYAVMDHLHPDWESWDRFLLENTATALRRDSLKNTHPIQLPGNLPVNINTSTAPIIYNKGAAVLRMLIEYLGGDLFQKAVNVFIEKYAYKNASTTEYWSLFEQVSQIPVEEFAEKWFKQEGYPLIEASLESGDLQLKQSRFTYQLGEYEENWIIPVKLTVHRGENTRIIDYTLNKRTGKVNGIPGDAIVKLNSEGKGFYRVKYNIENLQGLGELAEKRILSAADRFNLENDFYAFTFRGDYSIGEYLYFLEKYYSRESSFLPAADITGNLLELNLISPHYKSKITGYAVKLCERILDEIGLQPGEDETPQRSELRSLTLWAATVSGSKKIREHCAQLLEKIIAGGEINSDLLPAALKAGVYADPSGLDYIRKRLDSNTTPETERVYLLNALGAVSDSQLLREALDYTLRKVAKNNIYIVLASAARNPVALNWLWSWFTDNIKLLEQLPLTHLGRVIATVTPFSGLKNISEVESFFNSYRSPGNLEEDTIKMALEELKVYAKTASRI
ncbi:MAG: M1 family metallopeptidase [Candidatus Odinarchaeum yellowstonii]|uniref:Aminopeptidase n=1 Tax=Odinarchaeota yellowstonii (strain LCB_4) TaxID=1841599 RepID=A0AAF0IBD1_ODILC|nr:MAG: M1 family metallopeptidase [Candidatus Odinarchaeum yellowstonii]